jgi:hypothetical protein
MQSPSPDVVYALALAIGIYTIYHSPACVVTEHYSM